MLQIPFKISPICLARSDIPNNLVLVCVDNRWCCWLDTQTLQTETHILHYGRPKWASHGQPWKPERLQGCGVNNVHKERERVTRYLVDFTSF